MTRKLGGILSSSDLLLVEQGVIGLATWL